MAVDLKASGTETGKQIAFRRFRDWRPVLLWGFLALLLLATMNPALGAYDEAVILDGALRILHGQLPYRDFLTFYSPGSFYLMAWLFRLFGVYAFLGRLVYVGTMMATFFALIRISSLLGGRRLLGAAAAVVSTIWISASASYLYPVYPALCLALFAALCLICHWRSGKILWICGAGALIGCEIFFRHDLAFYSFVALLPGECFYHLAGKEPLPARWRRLLVHLGVLGVSIVLVAAPGVIYFLHRIPWSDIRFQLFYFPSHFYPSTRRLPFFSGGLASLLAGGIILIPPALAICLVVCFMQRRWREHLQRWQVSGFVAIAGLMLTLPISGLIRSDLAHECPSGITCSLFLACLLPTISLAGRTGRAAALATAVGFLAATTGAEARVVPFVRNTTALMLHPGRPGSLESLCHPPAGLQRAVCMKVEPVEAQVVEYIEHHSPQSTEVYSGAGRHDKLYVNDLLFYFLAARKPPTQWYDLNPGIQTTYPIQEQMIGELDRNHVEYVIRNLTWDRICEPNASCQSSGVVALDRYIDANYTPVAKFPQVVILRRSTQF